MQWAGELYCNRLKARQAGGTVSQYKKLYCDRSRGLAGRGHDTINCIVTGESLAARDFVSQYAGVYYGIQQAEQAHSSRLSYIAAHRRLSRHTVGSAMLWHIEG